MDEQKKSKWLNHLKIAAKFTTAVAIGAAAGWGLASIYDNKSDDTIDADSIEPETTEE